MNSGSSGDAVRNWNGTVNMTSGTIDGGDGSESNGLYNKGEANISRRCNYRGKPEHLHHGQHRI